MRTLVPAPTYDFRGHPVRRLIYRGELAFIGREIGSALGYEDDGKRFVSQLTAQWSTEIQEKVHWYRVKGAELRQLKAQAKEGAGPVPPSGREARRQGGALDGPRRAQLPEDGTGVVPSSVVDAPEGGALAGPRFAECQGEGAGAGPSQAPKALDLTFANELVVLTEEGLTLALMRSGQRIAVEFRKWLARDVVPQIARTGRYDPLAHLRVVRPSRDTIALMRIVGAAMAAGRLDVAADLIDAGRRLAAAPGEKLLPLPARLRASNRLLVRLVQRGALKGPRVAQLFHQPAWRPAEKAVLGLLIDLGGEALGVDLSYRDLADRIDVSRRTVIGAIHVLEKAGVVTRTRAQGGRNPEPNVYLVDADALAGWNEKERPETWESPR